MNLKKTLIISVAAVGAALFLYGCRGNDAASSASSESDTISVGTTAGYSEDVVEFVAKQAEKQGLHVKVVSFGDAVNDIAMFQISDECDAVENARDELKHHATAVIGDHDEDAVALWLKAHYKKETGGNGDV